MTVYYSRIVRTPFSSMENVLIGLSPLKKGSLIRVGSAIWRVLEWRALCSLLSPWMFSLAGIWIWKDECVFSLAASPKSWPSSFFPISALSILSLRALDAHLKRSRSLWDPLRGKGERRKIDETFAITGPFASNLVVEAIKVMSRP